MCGVDYVAIGMVKDPGTITLLIVSHKQISRPLLYTKLGGRVVGSIIDTQGPPGPLVARPQLESGVPQGRVPLDFSARQCIINMQTEWKTTRIICYIFWSESAVTSGFTTAAMPCWAMFVGRIVCSLADCSRSKEDKCEASPGFCSR